MTNREWLHKQHDLGLRNQSQARTKRNSFFPSMLRPVVYLSVAMCLFLTAALPIDQAENKLVQEVENPPLISDCGEVFCSGRFITCDLVNGQRQCVKRCPSCEPVSANDSLKFCGSDTKTYNSRCELHLAECVLGREILIECQASCPCDPPEIVEIDPALIKKISNYRREQEISKDFQASSDEILGIQKDASERNAQAEHPEGTANDLSGRYIWKKNEVIAAMQFEEEKTNGCSMEEFGSLPSRMLDWFHIIKLSADFRINDSMPFAGHRTLSEASFYDTKMRSMNDQLLCQSSANKMEVTCVEPTKWAFSYFDQNKDDLLSDKELNIFFQNKDENCMPLLYKVCDLDDDQVLQRAEFCKCLCVDPPCVKAVSTVTTEFVDGRLLPTEGSYVPRCDVDGFFLPRQCRGSNCWCVDRIGNEIPSCDGLLQQ